jgi:hypothetical protein
MDGRPTDEHGETSIPPLQLRCKGYKNKGNTKRGISPRLKKFDTVTMTLAFDL